MSRPFTEAFGDECTIDLDGLGPLRLIETRRRTSDHRGKPLDVPALLAWWDDSIEGGSGHLTVTGAEWANGEGWDIDYRDGHGKTVRLELTHTSLVALDAILGRVTGRAK